MSCGELTVIPIGHVPPAIKRTIPRLGDRPPVRAHPRAFHGSRGTICLTGHADSTVAKTLLARNLGGSAGRPEGGVMDIVLRAPEEWSPELALALRALLQQAIDRGCLIVVNVRGDAPADEISDLQARIQALVQDSGLAA